MAVLYKIQITKLPIDGVVMYLDGVEIVLDQIINSDELDLISVENETGYKGKIASFSYVVIAENDDLEKRSPEKTCFLNFLPEVGTPPVEINKTQDIEFNKSILFKDILDDYPVNNWDRIVFVSSTGNGSWTINGSEILFDTEYTYFDIKDSLEFNVIEEGSFSVYNLLVFKLGNHQEIFTNEHEIIISNKSKAFLMLNSFSESIGTDYEADFEVLIKNGKDSGDAKLEIDLSSLSQLDDDVDNKVTINGVDYTTAASSEVDGFIISDNGRLQINGSIFIKGNIISEESFSITLLEIDSDENLVDTDNNQVNIIINEQDIL